MTMSLIATLPLAFIAAVTPTLALFSGVSVTPMFVLLSISALAATWAQQPWRDVPRHVLAFVAVAMAWAMASCLWTATSVGHAVSATLSAASLSVLGLIAMRAASLLEAGGRRMVHRGLLAGVSLSVIVLLAEVIFSYPFTTFIHDIGPLAGASAVSRGTALMVLLLWPSVLIGPRPWAGVLFTAVTVAVVATSKHAAILALISAVVIFVGAWSAPRLMLWFGRVLVVAMVVGAPFAGRILPAADDAGQTGLFNSALHRVVIWRFSAERIAEHPWLGWGMDASRTLPGGDEEAAVVLVHRHGASELRHYPYMPLHPHNGVLQIWLELGLPGALLLAVLLWWIVGRALDAPPPQRRVYAAAVAAALIIGCLSYGTWQSWWQSSLWLTAVLFAAVTPPRNPLCAA